MSDLVEIHMLFTQNIEGVVVQSGKIFRTSEKTAQDLIAHGFAEPVRKNMPQEPEVFSQEAKSEKESFPGGKKLKKVFKEDGE